MGKGPIRINLALQGGGAHGAFTWGVLDRLLDEDDIEVAAISGTSAGAMNGAAFKSGLLEGGREGARANLDWLWQQLGAIQDTPMTQWMMAFAPPAAVLGRAFEFSLGNAMADAAARFSSPYAWGPFWDIPLRKVAERFHYDTVCAADGPRLFICATNVQTGKIRVFTGDDISPDAILASACLPTLFRAVEIENPATGETEAFWDGGYTGNPALFPLFAPDLPDDVLIVNINPLERAEVPRTPQQIHNRINEISFNSSLLRELRAIGFVKRLLDDGSLQRGHMKAVLVHMIADDALMTELSVATKLAPGPVLLAQLKDAGRAAADAFLAAHKSDLGQRSTVDLQAMYE
ncbi:patatin-like phospholipase family protein [Lutimaribacter sp. EGI FJ00015]|uniref:Patatin-like phospholipase family protein n=1 Tax=Lutimaribacter degradans TaxID=2945989 RepID=A0ACC5ZS83_9RHOB|nr:patatin-like phospholipase family protein [Lutimaribacter sp. EGI FJ00013]MCM2561184.1 patatin-like phospholipase family protein [Lutimaribacter sp. EGI FJ00013]MCO0611867.1 patatin-like phospholipase family protein [Lutimaribacter sp. EGI FJ00015]MCO0635012.1 patatin-like phospholipase family protein [Lutimaribacter sp. EGI FJ00014]